MCGRAQHHKWGSVGKLRGIGPIANETIPSSGNFLWMAGICPDRLLKGAPKIRIFVGQRACSRSDKPREQARCRQQIGVPLSSAPRCEYQISPSIFRRSAADYRVCRAQRVALRRKQCVISALQAKVRQTLLGKFFRSFLPKSRGPGGSLKPSYGLGAI